jgi:hypothetical protein
MKCLKTWEGKGVRTRGSWQDASESRRRSGEPPTGEVTQRTMAQFVLPETSGSSFEARLIDVNDNAIRSNDT